MFCLFSVSHGRLSEILATFDQISVFKANKTLKDYIKLKINYPLAAC